MSKPVYLYRAILTEQIEQHGEEWEDGELIPTTYIAREGTSVGRKSGYLSRSGAIDAALRNRLNADQFKIVRSEPVEFLTEAEYLQRRIAELKAQYAALVEVVA